MRNAIRNSILFILVIAILSGSAAYLQLRILKSSDPGQYGLVSEQLFRVGKISQFKTSFQLTDEEAQKAKEAGLDPTVVARALTTEAWLDAQKGEGGDATIYLALTSGETANCSNCGKCDARTEMQGRGFSSQIEAFDRLLAYWREHDLLGNSSETSHVSEYLYSDYSGSKGSCRAGALGCSQFMPGTAEIHLQEIAAPFDLWNPDVAMQVMALELYRLGWRKNLNLFQQIAVLLKWNGNEDWVTSIAKTANQYVAYNFTGVARQEIFNDIETLKTKVLALLDLLPDETNDPYVVADGDRIQIGDAQMSISNPIWSSSSLDHDRRKQGKFAWDLTGPYGTPIHPATDGTVITSDCDDINACCIVIIDHGEGISTLYAHMILGSMPFKPGDKVTKDDIIGKIGWTGQTSFGPHVHFEVRKNGVPVEPAELYDGKFPTDMGIPYEHLAPARKSQEESRLPGTVKNSLSVRKNTHLFSLKLAFAVYVPSNSEYLKILKYSDFEG